MAITFRLSSDLYKHYEYAMTKAKIAVASEVTPVELTADNYNKVLKALEATHLKSFKLKTKTPLHMERLYALEQIIGKVKAQAIYFPGINDTSVEPVAANSDSIDETDGKDVA